MNFDVLKVKREGNPRRRYAHVLPFIGKLSALEPHALNSFSTSILQQLPTLKGNILIIGIAESALVLAWWLKQKYTHDSVDLCYTSREPQTGNTTYQFIEPHSHAPDHYISLPKEKYQHIIIVEDEITTGETLKNIVMTLRESCQNFHVFVVADLRCPDKTTYLQQYFAQQQIKVSIQTVQATHKISHKQISENPDAIYMLGECINEGLELWHAAAQRPILRHITRSPWEVDKKIIYNRIHLSSEHYTTPHYLYNWDKPIKPKNVLITTYLNTVSLAEKLQLTLKKYNIETAIKIVKN